MRDEMRMDQLEGARGGDASGGGGGGAEIGRRRRRRSARTRVQTPLMLGVKAWIKSYRGQHALDRLDESALYDAWRAGSELLHAIKHRLSLIRVSRTIEKNAALAAEERALMGLQVSAERAYVRIAVRWSEEEPNEERPVHKRLKSFAAMHEFLRTASSMGWEGSFIRLRVSNLDKGTLAGTDTDKRHDQLVKMRGEFERELRTRKKKKGTLSEGEEEDDEENDDQESDDDRQARGKGGKSGKRRFVDAGFAVERAALQKEIEEQRRILGAARRSIMTWSGDRSGHHEADIERAGREGSDAYGRIDALTLRLQALENAYFKPGGEGADDTDEGSGSDEDKDDEEEEEGPEEPEDSGREGEEEGERSTGKRTNYRAIRTEEGRIRHEAAMVEEKERLHHELKRLHRVHGTEIQRMIRRAEKRDETDEYDPWVREGAMATLSWSPTARHVGLQLWDRNEAYGWVSHARLEKLDSNGNPEGRPKIAYDARADITSDELEADGLMRYLNKLKISLDGEDGTASKHFLDANFEFLSDKREESGATLSIYYTKRDRRYRLLICFLPQMGFAYAPRTAEDAIGVLTRRHVGWQLCAEDLRHNSMKSSYLGKLVDEMSSHARRGVLRLTEEKTRVDTSQIQPLQLNSFIFHCMWYEGPFSAMVTLGSGNSASDVHYLPVFKKKRVRRPMMPAAP